MPSLSQLAALAALVTMPACAELESEIAGGKRITLGNGQPGYEVACVHTTVRCQFRAAEICGPRGYSIYATGLRGRGVGLSKRGVRMQIECL
ncbi:MAG: hypothetical protein AAFY59_18275 [Pseudomonadota bacterium]